MPYIISMILLIAAYVAVIPCMKYMKNTRLWNSIFSVLTVLCYLFVVIKMYCSVGIHDWNFQNTLPVANVSPFMFFSVMLIHLFPVKIKKHFYLLVSLLSVGMFASPILGCIYNASISYKFHLSFLSDYIAHIALSLWGVYVVKSGQVTLSKRNTLISGGIIVSVAFVMMILNVIFDTAFFGLSLNGKHNIYNNVLTKSSYLSALLYFAGVIFVLGIGYLYSAFMSRKECHESSADEAVYDIAVK